MQHCEVCGKPWSLAYCGHRAIRHTTPPPGTPCAAPATLDRVYRALLAELSLHPHHHCALSQRGLPATEIAHRGYRTLPLAGRAVLAKHLVQCFGAAAWADEN